MQSMEDLSVLLQALLRKDVETVKLPLLILELAMVINEPLFTILAQRQMAGLVHFQQQSLTIVMTVRQLAQI